VGGGITSIDMIRDVLHAGADKVSINTAAIKNPEFVKESSRQFGSQCIVVAIDAKKVADNKWEIFTHGGRNRTGIDAIEWSKRMNDYGAGELLVTSMDADGTKNGYDIELTQTISELVSIPVIASGGAGTKQHIADVLSICDAALLASLLHYGEETIQTIKETCKNNNLAIR